MDSTGRQRWTWQIVSVRDKRPTGGITLWLFPTESKPPRWMKQGHFACQWIELGTKQGITSAGTMGYVRSSWATRYANRLVTVVEAYFLDRCAAPRRGDFLRPTVEMNKLMPRWRSIAFAKKSVEDALTQDGLSDSQKARLEMRLGQLTGEIDLLTGVLRDAHGAAAGRTYPYPNREKWPKDQVPSSRERLFDWL